MMLCVRCNTPLIPGETYCRICGTSVKKTEQMEALKTKNNNEENEEVILIDETAINEVEEVIADLERMIHSSTKEIDELEIIDDFADEIKFINDEPEIWTIEETAVPEVLVSPAFEPEIAEIYEKETTVPKKEPTSDHKKLGINMVAFFVVLGIALLSVVTNIILLINLSSKDLTKKDIEVSADKIIVSSLYYKTLVPKNWISTETTMNGVVLMDEAETWSLALEYVDSVKYEDIVSNAKEITDKFKSEKYVCTQDRTQTIDNKEIYSFKGKYQDYSSYIIVYGITDNGILVGNLRFKGEIAEDIVTATNAAMVVAIPQDISEFWKSGFEFTEVGTLIKSAIPSDEDVAETTPE